MLDATTIRAALPLALGHIDLPELGSAQSGKVRESFARGDTRLLVATDRLSAFDRILARVPYKGQVLNQLAAFWFERTRDIIPNHVLAIPDPNITLARECTPFPVEVVVRGYVTGVTSTSLWHHYERGARELYGIRLPDGLRKNDPLPTPLITPTTKAAAGHDDRLTSSEVVDQGYVPAGDWDVVQRAALALFARGREIALAGGLILVDTKYEFGRAPGGQITLIDEIHTPDSSRFWLADSYAQRHARGEEPESFDKELVRLWYAEHGYRGDGDPPAMPDDLIVQTSQRYIAVYEMLTGTVFQPAEYPADERIRKVLSLGVQSPGVRESKPPTPDSLDSETPESQTPDSQTPRLLTVIIMGSRSDLPLGERVAETLQGFGVPCELRIASAHKSARHLLDLLAEYERDPRAKVYVTIAGRSNALSGMVDANVTAPVIACPPASDAFGGADLYSSLRMPGGVAPAVVLEPEGAALLAAKILALAAPALREHIARIQGAATEVILAGDRGLRGS